MSLLCQYLDTSGVGLGGKNANADYSAESSDYKITAQPGEILDIARMLIYIEDAGVFDAGSYGNAIALTNGITVQHRHGTRVVTDLTDGVPIKTNAEWGRLCYDVNRVSFGSGNEHLLARWTFAKSGAPLTLRPGESLEVTLADNFTGLVEHYFLVQGRRRSS